MRILIACEESQEVCKAFRAKLHDAFSCDLKPCSGGRPDLHIQADIREVLKGGHFATQAGTKVYIARWDMLIAHPVCTRLCNSGVLRLYKGGQESRRH